VVLARGRTQEFSLGVKVKVKIKVHTLDIVPVRIYSESPLQERSGMTRVVKRSHTCTTPTKFIRTRHEPNLPLPSQP